MSQTAQEFFEGYLAENIAYSVACHQLALPMKKKFFSAGCVKHYEEYGLDREPERLEKAEVHGSTAQMFTILRLDTVQIRHRYQLRKVNERWEIYAFEFECLTCSGTDQQPDKQCDACHGEGWSELFKDRS